MTENPWHYHMGRSWTGHPLEDECPCGKAPCGLVDSEQISPECNQHPAAMVKTMRQIHPADECPGVT